MGLVQIVLIWGVASAALFPSISSAGEWEEFKDLKAAMVRSSAKRDFQLPVWITTLDHPRPEIWYWIGPKPAEKPGIPEPVKNVQNRLDSVLVSQ